MHVVRKYLHSPPPSEGGIGHGSWYKAYHGACFRVRRERSLVPVVLTAARILLKTWATMSRSCSEELHDLGHGRFLGFYGDVSL